MSKDELLEKLSDMEHEQWCEWFESISDDISSLLAILNKIDDESLGDEDKLKIRNVEQNLNRRSDLCIPYSDLPEDEKEKDRVYARKILSVLHD